jgi:cytochrome c oxidase subunit II
LRRIDSLKSQMITSAFVTALALSACTADSPSSLAPRGPGASQIAELWWIMFGLAAVVCGIVFALLGYSIFRKRTHQLNLPVGDSAEGPGHRFILIAGGAAPAIILIVLFAFTLQAMAAISEPDEEADLTIEVIGHQWWWEIVYPDHDIVTANEIYIPVGQTVLLKLTSEDVIHSFAVPELQGRMDLIPGQTNSLWLEASEPGEYWGQCAEYCGLQHAHMGLLVIAVEEEEFEAWAAHEQEPAPTPSDDLVFRGQQIFLGSACVYCHTVRGTNATSDVGPDLTHFASRQTIGAGTVPNTRGHLAGWIIDSQSIKPGNLMPPVYMDPDDLEALLAYLESLD